MYFSELRDSEERVTDLLLKLGYVDEWFMWYGPYLAVDLADYETVKPEHIEEISRTFDADVIVRRQWDTGDGIVTRLLLVSRKHSFSPRS